MNRILLRPGRKGIAAMVVEAFVGVRHIIQTAYLDAKVDKQRQIIKELRVAYVCACDPLDINNWSGLAYYMARELRKRITDIDFIVNLKTRRSVNQYVKREYYKRVLGLNYLNDRTRRMGEHYAKEIQKGLRGKEYQLIFCPSTMPIAYLETSAPIVFWTDATFSSMIDYYFFDICKESIDDGNDMEGSALKRCALAIYSSDWAARSAIQDYKVDPSKVKVIPFGANLESVPARQDTNRELLVPLRLLMIGRDWTRKGGEIALETVDLLNGQGVQSNLVVVGCEPPVSTKRPYLSVYPQLNKSKIADAATLYRLFAEAHFLILPSRAECTPVVFSEASAFGLPVLTSRVGGVPTIVKEGINGFTFPLQASGREYASLIISILPNALSYARLRSNSRAVYDNLLSWDAAMKQVMQCFEGVIANGGVS